MYEMLMKQMTERENVTEPLNAPDRMKWVHRMNNIRNRATEIVNTDLINSLRTSVAAPLDAEGAEMPKSRCLSFPGNKKRRIATTLFVLPGSY